MATGGNTKLSSLSSVKGSDFVIEFFCNPCNKEGHTNEAINFCVECSEFFCLSCTNQHTKFGITSGHTVVNSALAKKVGGAPQSSGLLPSEVCREHHGDKITTYCADHDLVLCNTCVSVDHRLCGGISYIPIVASGSKHNTDIPHMQQEMSETLKAVSQIKLYLHDLLTTADEKKNAHLKLIRDCTERLIKHAGDLEKSAVDEVNGCHKTTTDELRSEIKSLDDAAKAIEDRLKNLDNANVNSESQVFVDIKRGRNEVESARQLEQKLTTALAGMPMPEFVVKGDVYYFLNEVPCLGRYAEKKAYKADLYGEFDVRVSGDKYECVINGICELPDGTILVADVENTCIKKLDTSYKITKSLKMPPYPCGICQTGEDEIAVTLTQERKVQFVNVRGKLKMTRAFNVSEVCRGIMFSRGELFVTCGGRPGDKHFATEGPGFVGVYSITGSLLRKLQLDHRGQQIFTLPRQITKTDNGNKVHIADRDGGVITLDMQGNVLSTFSEGLQVTTGVVAVTDDNLLVCGQYSNTVLQIGADSKMVCQLLGEKDGVLSPRYLLFQRESSRLVVTQIPSNKIKVFNLKL